MAFDIFDCVTLAKVSGLVEVLETGAKFCQKLLRNAVTH
jgi:hypothetical protein